MLQFDEAYYLAKNPDVAAAISAGHLSSALEHYQQNGFREGRDPHPFFDTSYYLETYPDVAAAGINPFDHFNSNGNSEGRAPNAFFDAAYYLEQNPDVAAAGVDPLEHYLGYGGREGRDPSPAFDSAYYNLQNPDVMAAGLNPLAHYLAYGQDEGRVPHAQFGAILRAEDTYNSRGVAVSGAGDINGDGHDDILVGIASAPRDGHTWVGESYVVFGKQYGLAPELALPDLDGTNGFVLKGSDYLDQSGKSVAGVGDVNGDGIDDILIGAPSGDGAVYHDIGESYLIYGKTENFDARVDLGNLDGSNGTLLQGIETANSAGMAVSSAGDINADGLDDFVIGARGGFGASHSGPSFVVFGKPAGFGASFDLQDLDGSNGFSISGAPRFGSPYLSAAGDMNGDGISDLIVGADFVDPNGVFNAGATYVIFGRDTGFDATFDLSSLNGSNGFTLNGIAVSDGSGNTVSRAGDINNDGIDDILIGARYASPNGVASAGETYVVFGSNTGFDATFDLGSLNGGNGFVLKGSKFNKRSGSSISNAGDVNGDGIDDILIGAPLADKGDFYNAGVAYIVFGSADGFAAQLDLASLDGTNGLRLSGTSYNDTIGSSVSGAGDVNGDGIADILIGAEHGEQFGINGVGHTYVVYGGETLGRFDAIDGTSDGEIQLALIGHGYDL